MIWFAGYMFLAFFSRLFSFAVYVDLDAKREWNDHELETKMYISFHTNGIFPIQSPHWLVKFMSYLNN